MASSSTSTSTSHTVNNNDYVFDVFINHRGPDVKKTLATDLYHRLCKHDLRVFLDEQELRVGENLTPQIESAIRTSSVNIAIFSPNYAYSTWCLDELVLMLDCMSKYKSTIIPVFYDGVKPTELRWVEGGKGVYAQALRELQEKKDVEGGPRYDSNTLKKWKKALSDVPEIIGFDGEKYNSMEQLLEDVVEGVLKNVKRRLYVSEYPKGLDGKLKDFETTMSLQQEDGKVRIIGIVGLGGVGKTTLAKEFFNNQRSKYKRCCFLSDIRDKALTTLQSDLLKHLTQSNVQIGSTDEGKEKLRRLLPSSDCLIILDDVDHIKQLDALLLPAKDALKTNSLILVTSRNKDVLIRSQIPETSMYMLQSLDPEHSRELFCWHAFRKPHPAVGFDKEVEKFLGACLGLPLSIKVFGSLLCGINDLNHWEAQFRKISNMLPDDIQGRLRISYDGLDEEEKKVFLDIACFFRGEKRDRVIRILNRTGWEGTLGLWKLENRCLVEVDSENRLRMHDHVRDMGRYLAEKEPPDGELRLWNPTANLFHKLSGQLPVRGISLVNGNEFEQSFENLGEPARTHLLSNMRGLQLLKAKGYFPKCLLTVCHHLPNLIYLEWLNCPESSFPSWIPTKNLRVLHIKGKRLKTLWQHESQAPLQLRELCIRTCYGPSRRLESLPDSVGNLTRLQHLNLSECSDLQTLPYSVGNLAGLQHLDLGSCYNLQTLPDSVGNLAGLQHLNLRWCNALQRLPDSVGNLARLQHLDLSSCSALQTLPDSVGNLARLQHLDSSSCTALQTLPDSVGNLARLQHLDLSLCTALQTLPDSVGNLAGLQHLNLSHCSALQWLPDSVGNLAGLQHLNLSDCSAWQSLPDSVGNLARLQHLNLTYCYALQGLPDSVGNLAGLQHLKLSHCRSLQTLPDSVGNLASLQHLDLTHCSHLQRLPYSVGNLAGLQHLDLGSCCNLQTLPDSVGKLAGLQYLDLSDCFSLQRLPDSVGNLAGLQHLDLTWCSALQRLPDSVGNLAGLQDLDLRECSALQLLPDSVGNLAGLPYLDLSKCSALQWLPDSVGNLAGLQHLNLSYCSTLQMLPDSVGNLTGLQHLNLSSCSALQILTDSVGNLAGLQHLNLSSCSALQTLPDSVGNLARLQHLNLSSCSALQTLPDSVGNLASLQHLNLSDCSALQRLPDSVRNLAGLQDLGLGGCSTLHTLLHSVWDLRGLRSLDLSECPALHMLPDSVSKLRSLRRLDLSNCSALQRLPNSIGYLTSLQTLDLAGCSALQRLPDSIGNLTSLRTLQLAHCSNLEMVPNVEHLGSLEYFVVTQCSKLQWDAGIVEQLRQRLGKGGFIEESSQERWSSVGVSSDGEGFTEESSNVGEGFNEESSDESR